jgi:predicted P-loop ATPase
VNRYFAETEFNQKKDDLILLTKNVIVFVDEWRSINEKDPDFMKYIITAKHFDVRKAYRADDKKYTRVASLCGTSNHDDVIVDTHHNRRIVPIHVESINWEAYNRVDKNAVFSEALALYRGGYGVEVDVDEMQLLRGSQDQFEVAKREKELLYKYFSGGDGEAGEILTTTEILVVIEKATGLKNLSVNALGKELKAAGWERKRTTNKTWGWFVTMKEFKTKKQ